MDIFNFGHCRHGYYIKLYDLISDDEIAKKLGITYEKYIEILKQFNTYLNIDCDEYFFKNHDDMCCCINYLEEKYGMMLKLVGE